MSDDDEPPSLDRFLSAAQFWQLMERWGVDDARALKLLEFSGKIGKSGKRPRFRFSPHPKRLTTYLAEIDAALTEAGLEPAWLAKPNRSAPFKGKAPLAYMIRGGIEGMGETHHFLNRVVLRAALKG
jgi:hypothetical protein